ncbi:hypothetical protein C8R43DRAFT_609431 [Mycena crocata]|nr:hypothetical protein C8R43DRAFT_609431 [Mycena crocata]
MWALESVRIQKATVTVEDNEKLMLTSSLVLLHSVLLPPQFRLCSPAAAMERLSLETTLPLDLERHIFELCAHWRPVSIPKLMLVAWRVKVWFVAASLSLYRPCSIIFLGWNQYSPGKQRRPNYRLSPFHCGTGTVSPGIESADLSAQLCS